MKISMLMLLDRIAASVNRHSLGDMPAELVLSGALPYLPGRPMQPDHAYVISAADALHLPDSGRNLLIIYGDENDYSAPDFPHIVLRKSVDFGTALALVLEAFERYNHWYETLQDELAGVPDLSRICTIGCELLENPILLFAPDHTLAASGKLDLSRGTTYLEAKGGSVFALTDEAYWAIVGRPEYTDDVEIGQVTYMANPLGGNTLYTNIVCRQLEYRLCVNDTSRPFTPGDMQICKIISDTLQTAMEMDHSREGSAKADLCDLFRDLLDRREVENESGVAILSAWNWVRYDRFICLVMEKTNQNLRFVSNDQYICSKLEELLSDVCTFIHDGRLICMIHLGGSLTADSIQERLEVFLRDNIFTVGISDEFEDVSKSADYYKEACIAISEGMEKHAPLLFHRFSDHALTHLCKCGFDGLPPICYCERNVRRLSTLQDSRVDYCETLRTYVENDRNLLRTAELLHIHRTTLFYRLNKIKEELDVDLDDPDTRLRMWISFKLLSLDGKI